ncbi:AraC family transcriptional regulator [Vibrio hippocampi]|uniref:HTH-type transcriptional activator RhaR n=1 Tax=Vibrio hippocampi TaxID=654686 RepID=A0ABN8DNR5_9VIBR|nr:AraC family transcriptional regulator [Vibrio hippocampi]CAH0529661.1 HTH-type transcriptional activator RhaR [Vibrio hippocampi]
MVGSVRDIDQSYWTSQFMPHLTVRYTKDSRQSYKAHYHADLSIGIIEAGKTDLSLPNEHLFLTKGDLILIEPKLVHACNPVENQPRSYHMLYIDNDWCCQRLSKLFGFEVLTFTVDQALFRHPVNESGLGQLIPQLLKQESLQTASMVESSLIDLLSLCCTPKNGVLDDDKLALQLKQLLLQDIENTPQLDVLARQLGQSKETLIRKFKSQFGITPKSFLNNHRIEKAKVLLRGGMQIADVAIEVGFSDQSQLHRSFVNYTASTPRQYQNIKSIFDNNH